MEEYINGTNADLSQQVLLAEPQPKLVKRDVFKSDAERVHERELAERKAKDDVAEARKPWCKFGKLVCLRLLCDHGPEFTCIT